MSSLQPSIALIGTLAVVWAAAWVDFRTFRIPNALVRLRGRRWGC